MLTNPLDLPEILARVGHFLPLWVPQKDPSLGIATSSIRFEPHTLLNCSLVSKLWHQTLTPILWHTYFSFHMGYNANSTNPHETTNYNNVVTNGGSVPPEVVSRNSIHFRIFEAAGNSPGPFYCTQLVKVSFFKEYYRQTKMGVKNQRALVRSNPAVRELYWCGADDPHERLVGEDFARLKGLRILRLSRWSGRGGCLKDVLRSVAGSLQLLGLGAVVDVQWGP